MEHANTNDERGRVVDTPFRHDAGAKANATTGTDPNSSTVPRSSTTHADRSPSSLTGLSGGDASLEVFDAMHGEVQIVCTLSGSSIIATPEQVIAALERFKAAQSQPLAIIGNGEYANHIGE